MAWDYERDLVTITFNPNAVAPIAFASAITKLGYEAKAPEAANVTKVGTAAPLRLWVPNDAPAFFVEAVNRAKIAKRPIVIDFWAEWCASCLRLKHGTLAHADVAKALRSVELIYVDLDKYPALGEAYGVAAIPDVMFIDLSGKIVDRLQNVEPPPAFVVRVKELLELTSNRDGSH